MADINKSGYTVKKTGSVRQAGQIASGDGSTGRGATARAGTLASDKGGSGEGRSHWYGSYREGGMGLNKFRPTKSGGVRGGKGK
jgi:hypothetical protein